MKLEVIERGKAVPKGQQQAVLSEWSSSFRERQEAQAERRPERYPAAPQWSSDGALERSIEVRLVKAFSVLQRSQRNPAPREPSQHGVGYMLEREDKWAAAVEGGGWLSSEPAPPPARAREITESEEALQWLILINCMSTRRIVATVAIAKRGDAERRIPWDRIRPKLGNMADAPKRTLQWRYRLGLRIIARELTLARLAPQV